MQNNSENGKEKDINELKLMFVKFDVEAMNGSKELSSLNNPPQENSSFSNSFFGGSTNFYGTSGNDSISLNGSSSIYGGNGNDTIKLYYNDFVSGGSGNDYIENVYINPNGTKINGDDGDDKIIGASKDTINGGTGNDSINAYGGLCNGGSGNDTISSYFSAGGSFYGGEGNDSITAVYGGSGNHYYGDDGSDTIIGGNQDTIDGGLGDDSMSAISGSNLFIGGGNDIIKLNNHDTVFGGDGNDSIISQGYYDNSTCNNYNIANLIYAGHGNNMILVGNQDTVYSGDGNDSISAGVLTSQHFIDSGSGNDTINYTGFDTICAGAGDDYIASVGQYPNNSGSYINLGAGNDTIISGGSNQTIEAEGGNNYIEINSGSDNIINAGSGNDTIVLNSQGYNNKVNLGNGNNTFVVNSGYYYTFDKLTGGTGNDTYIINSDCNNQIAISDSGGVDILLTNQNVNGLQSVIENLTLTGNSNIQGIGNYSNNMIIGNTGSNYIDGRDGADTMKGGAGSDTYFVDNAGDVVVENLNEGIDSVNSSINYTLGSNLENLTLSGTAQYATGNELNNIIIGNNQNNFLDGKLGADTMKGGLGNDVYYVNNAGDLVIEAYNQGVDTVNSIINYTLGSNLENLILSNNAYMGTGNALNNNIYGNLMGNYIDGGLGADTMRGSLGNDTYVVDNINDIVKEYSNEGIDTVISSIDYSLGSNVENVFLSGDSNLSAVGNELNNHLRGNGGANILSGGEGNDYLDGGAGIDTLIGGSGNDNYSVDNINDLVIENAYEGVDTVLSSVNYTLGAELENLYLYGGNSDLYGVGNDKDNKIFGDFGNNNLYGGRGNDTLNGGQGTNILAGDEGDDTYFVNIKDSATNIIKDTSGSNNIFIEGNARELMKNLVIFREGNDLVINCTYNFNDPSLAAPGDCGYNCHSDSSMRVVDHFASKESAISSIALNDGSYISAKDINIIIQETTAFAANNGIQLTEIKDIQQNPDLMNIVASHWQ